VPTWCPFRLQFYCNSHNWLARRLAAGIGFTMVDNALFDLHQAPMIGVREHIEHRAALRGVVIQGP
jgi:hypothetical protein